MNQTQIKLEQLLKLSQSIDFNDQFIEAKICLNEQYECDLLQEFEDGKIPDLSFTTKNYYDFEIGETIEYRIALLHTEKQFASYANFIFHQLDFSQKKNISSEFVIYEEEYKVSNGDFPISPILKLFSEFIKILSEKFFYRDNQIIFFSKTHCEIYIHPRNYEKYIDLAKLYKSLNLDESLRKFIDWLMVDGSNKDDGLNKILGVHQSERYSLAASEFVDHLVTVDKDERIFNLLKNIDIIFQSTQSKYSLYLEDFKYSKFIDKITKYSEDFLNKVNKVISDLQTQILAIPLAVSAITVFKDSEKINVYIYIAFLIYLLMVFYSGCQQAYNISHIQFQIKQFNEIVKLPKGLAPEWQKEIAPVNKKILWHKFFLVLVAFFIGFLVGICILNIPILYKFISNLDQIEFNLWVIASLFFIKMSLIAFDK